MPQDIHFEITIPSETAAGQSLQERIVAMLLEREYPPRDVFAVRLAIEEALVNAIKHGNHEDPRKQVRVDCLVTNDNVRIEIEDEGTGFVLADVPDPTAPENLERSSGRGIMLMKNFMNRIEYNERGNRITMEKHRETVKTA